MEELTPEARAEQIAILRVDQFRIDILCIDDPAETS